ncbi:transcriptional regulator [Quisquiliibacterium transsilvanicum]|uniref:transcriptional regulator n=1 Tax=Quisquiliibacterium transsilvanicum TaxID=1549638 RepID=UPI0031B61CE9
MLRGMNLHEYLVGSSNAALAQALGVPPPLVSQWKTGARPIPIERCLQIERATGSVVRRWDLRPDDWWAIWPELVETDGAPPVPSREAA